ncbi:MAG: IS630 family transposase, partial [Albidovulum sp.]|nr:IS630 family transposase [Albidovulum sp.]
KAQTNRRKSDMRSGRLKLAAYVSTVFGIPERNGLKPRKAETFKVSRDPRFELKVRDVVGLYADPSDRAVVIPAGEKTQLQALVRTQRPLPMKPGHPETRAHDCKRNGTSRLLAALDVAAGKAAGQMVERHRSEKFLEPVTEGIELGTPVHFILDNVSSHKSAEVSQWLKERRDWSFHFTPVSASWINTVEGYIEHHNANVARPFRWSGKPEDLVEAWKRGRRKLKESAPEARRSQIA